MKVRSAAAGLAAALSVSVAAIGCGKGGDRDPQPVNVKQDSRLKRTGDGEGGKKANPGGDAGAVE